MKIRKELIQQIANGETMLNGEPVDVAKVITTNNLFTKFCKYAFFYDGEDENLFDIQDCLLDFKCFGAEIKIDVDKSIHPSSVYQVFGMTPSIALHRLFDEVNEEMHRWDDKFEGKTFTIKGVKGKFRYLGVMFHYCYAKGRITEDQLLDAIRIA